MLEVRERILRTLLDLLLLMVVLVASYVSAPLLQQAFQVTLPGTALVLGVPLLIVLFALLVLLTARFIRGAVAMMGIRAVTWARLFPGLRIEQAGVAVRVMLNFSIVIFLLIAVWVAAPFVVQIPEIGSLLASGAQLFVTAVIVLFFWDLGRTFHRALEEAVVSGCAMPWTDENTRCTCRSP